MTRNWNSWFWFEPKDEMMTSTTPSIMGNDMQSEWLVCVQCDTEFEYDVVEQKRHISMDYDTPRRCPECRKHKTRIMSGWERKMNKTRQKNNQRKDEDDSRGRRCRI